MSAIFETYSQEIAIPAKINPLPAYSFLSHPPPQKKRPVKPLPSPPSAYTSQANPPLELRVLGRRPSNTFSSIRTWAAHVQPGSPASLSPRSPASSIRRRLSSATLPRRPSIGHGKATRSISGTLINVDTPMTATTPSITMKECKAGLTAAGYTSVFFGFPKTPISAAVPIPIKLGSPTSWVHVDGPKSAGAALSASVERKPSSGHRRLRSLGGTLKSRARSAAPSSPTRPLRVKSKAAKPSADAIIKRKKSKYAPVRPAPLANELALMQFADGGNTDATIRRFMESHAGGRGGAGVGDVFRDGRGGVWWDEDEELEYRHLLAPSSASAAGTLCNVPLTPASGASSALGNAQWVKFSAAGAGTRTVRSSAESRDSDLDERFLVRAEPGALDGGEDLVAVDSMLPYLQPHASGSGSGSVLALPARPRRAAPHLCKADLLVDAAFRLPPPTPRTPRSPRRRASASAFPAAVGNTTAAKPARARGTARRRPAPLAFVPPAPGAAIALAVNVLVCERGAGAEGTEAEKGRREYDATAFRPRARPARGAAARPGGMVLAGGVPGGIDVRVVGEGAPAPVKTPGAKKPSRFGVRGLFRAK